MVLASRFPRSIVWLVLFGLVACAPDVVALSDAGGSGTSTGGPSPDTLGASEAHGEGADHTTTGADATGTSESDADGSMSEASTGAEPICGNGKVEDGEDCDDDGESALCDDDCTSATCGDGVVNATAGEGCDDGEESAGCNLDCTPALCGDGHVNPTALEECDDGGQSAACDVDCTVAQCGDGVFNAAAGELCDEGGATALCDADCTPIECGDGVLNLLAGEECDEGGETIFCNLDCSSASCGDGIINVTAGEACDDAGPSVRCDGDCTAVVCGDSNANTLAGEACDTEDLAGGACQGLGFGVGALSCDGGCSYVTSGCSPGSPVLDLTFSPIKRFDFMWAAAMGAEYYQLFESPALGEPYVQLGGDIVNESVSFEMPLHLRYEASYVLWACNAAGCTDSAVVDVMSSLAEAVGYVKASNTGTSDVFGGTVALSGDGNTLAVGAQGEDSSATGIGGNQADDGAVDSGAVYVFVRDAMGGWSQQAYIKASNVGAGDLFGLSIGLSGAGNTLAVGARDEDSGATGIDGNQADNSSNSSGAVYVFDRDAMGVWSQQAYIKPSNTDANDHFGMYDLPLSADGNTLAVGAPDEDGNATGVGGNQADNSVLDSGAVYVFVRDAMGVWSQQAYVKASNTDVGDRFGVDAGLSGDGNILVVGAYLEDSNATGVGGNQIDNSIVDSGAVYVFERNGMGAWSQHAYVKASNTGTGDRFGESLALSGDGNTFAVGAYYEDSNASGLGGSQVTNGAVDSGAAYVFVHDEMGGWSQRAYVKAANTDASDWFGESLALSDNGTVFAVGSMLEASNATDIDGNEANNSAAGAGAVYLY